MTRIGEYLKQAQDYAQLAEDASDLRERKRMIFHANDFLLLANKAELLRHGARLRALRSKELKSSREADN